MSQDDKNQDLTMSLTEMQRYVTQQAGTEPPYTGKLLYNEKSGIYRCICCDSPLFISEKKFDAGCGWPSFYQSVDENAIRYIEDNSHGMRRIEVRCQKCNAHLGHVFPDGPKPTGQRYCINSASLRFRDNKTDEITEG